MRVDRENSLIRTPLSRRLHCERLEERDLLDGLPPIAITPVPFVSAEQPNSVAVDAFGNVSVAHISDVINGTSGVTTLNPVGTPIGVTAPVSTDILISLFTLRAPFADFETGDVLALGQNGGLFQYFPGTGAAALVGNLRLYTYDISSIYDVQTGAYSSFGGTIVPQAATFGDFAVHRNTLVATGYQGGHAFVLSLTSTANGIAPKVLVSSIAEHPGNSLARGIAVNNRGRVLTTLPFSRTGQLNFAVDQPIAFDVDFHQGGVEPYLPLDDITFMSSWGMATDSYGNFLVSPGVIGSSATPNGAGVISIAHDFSSYLPMILPGGVGGQLFGRDVVVDNDNIGAFLAINAPFGAPNNVVWQIPYAPLIGDGGGAPSDQADIAPFTPVGWSGPLIISTSAGTHVDSQEFTSADSLYVDWAVTNRGAATPDNSIWFVYVLRDLNWRNVETVVGSVETFEVLMGEDVEYGPMSPGVYEFLLFPNYFSGNLSESDLGNNVYRKVITVTGPQQRVRGQIFNDVDGDGAKDLDELGLSGRQVFADLNGDGRHGSLGTTSIFQASNDDFGFLETATSPMNVTLAGQIIDVDVTFSISHNEVDEVNLYLESPKGTRIRLFEDLPNDPEYRNFTVTTLDDEAGASIFSGRPPYTGRFRPETPLSAFDGENAYGTWRLIAEDDALLDSGVLENWMLTLTTEEPSATTDANGRYELRTAPGSFTVLQVQPDSWKQTLPAPAAYAVTLGVNQRIDDRDFGSRFAPLLPGDFDGSRVVDGGDFLTWQRALGSTASPPGGGADATGNGSVTGADLVAWKQYFSRFIVDASREAAENATVQPSDPRPGTSGQNFFNVEGDGLGAFASYGVARFDAVSIQAHFDETFGPGNWTIATVDLQLTQSNAAFSAAGPVSVLFTNDDSTSMAAGASPLVFPHDDSEFSDAAFVRGFDFAPVATGTVETLRLFAYNEDNSAGGAALSRDLAVEAVTTLLLTPASDAVAATYAGISNTMHAGPALIVSAIVRAAVVPEQTSAAADAVYEYPSRPIVGDRWPASASLRAAAPCGRRTPVDALQDMRGSDGDLQGLATAPWPATATDARMRSGPNYRPPDRRNIELARDEAFAALARFAEMNSWSM